MKDIDLIKALVGPGLKREELKYVDCYVTPQIGVFIPSRGSCGYAARKGHSHPAYMAAIMFSAASGGDYSALMVSPDIPHDDMPGVDYYCILIDQEYFVSQYRLYRDEVPLFRWEGFRASGDIIRLINTFAMEYTAGTPNAEITLDAQAALLVHWIIRSLLGGSGYSRTLSANCLVARVQHYMELHFHEEIKVGRLAKLEHMSDSGFTRLFRKETGVTPIRYLLTLRIEKSKELLQRNEMPITEVGTACGFGSSTHFAAAFKRLTGVSPSRYRAAYRH